MSNPITTLSHLCVVRAQTEHHYYINGKILAPSTTGHPGLVPGNGVLILGHSQHGPINGSTPGAQTFDDEGFQGEIDGLKVWDRALNASEINRVYASGECHCQGDAKVIFDRIHSRMHGPVKHNRTDNCDENI